LNPTLNILATQMMAEPPKMQTPEKMIKWVKEPWSCGMSAPWIGRLVKPLFGIKISICSTTTRQDENGHGLLHTQIQ
jgi:hypothetical protein